MTQLQATPELLIDLANKVNGDPYGFLDRARQELDAAQVDSRAFGVIGSALLGGSFESARTNAMQSCAGGADAVDTLASGLASVAKTYAAAEGINADGLTLDARPATPGFDGTMPKDGFGSIAGGLGVYAATIPMMLLGDMAIASIAEVNAEVASTLTASSTLAPEVFVAMTMWMLTKPDDSEINKAASLWSAAANDVATAHTVLQTLISSDLDRAWPQGDGARPAFDAWYQKLDADLGQLAAALPPVVQSIQDAVSHIHTVNTIMLYSMISALASLIALTAMDWLFGAGEIAKRGVALWIIGQISGGVAAILTIIGDLVYYAIGEWNDVKTFSAMSDRGTVPDFQRIGLGVDWSAAPADPGASPSFSLGGNGGSDPDPGGGSGDPTPIK